MPLPISLYKTSLQPDLESLREGTFPVAKCAPCKQQWFPVKSDCCVQHCSHCDRARECLTKHCTAHPYLCSRFCRKNNWKCFGYGQFCVYALGIPENSLGASAGEHLLYFKWIYAVRSRGEHFIMQPGLLSHMWNLDIALWFQRTCSPNFPRCLKNKRHEPLGSTHYFS